MSGASESPAHQNVASSSSSLSTSDQPQTPQHQQQQQQQQHTPTASPFSTSTKHIPHSLPRPLSLERRLSDPIDQSSITSSHGTLQSPRLTRSPRATRSPRISPSLRASKPPANLAEPPPFQMNIHNSHFLQDQGGQGVSEHTANSTGYNNYFSENNMHVDSGSDSSGGGTGEGRRLSLESRGDREERVTREHKTPTPSGGHGGGGGNSRSNAPNTPSVIGESGGKKPRRRKRKRKNKQNANNNSNNPGGNTNINGNNDMNMNSNLNNMDAPKTKKKPQYTITILTKIEPVQQRYLNQTAGGFTTPATPDDLADFRNEYGGSFSFNPYGSMASTPHGT